MLVLAGCAFVTYDSKESAERAQKELHDSMTLPGVSFTTKRCCPFALLTARIPSHFSFKLSCTHLLVQMSRPLQVKPAGTDGRAGNVIRKVSCESEYGRPLSLCLALLLFHSL